MAKKKRKKIKIKKVKKTKKEVKQAKSFDRKQQIANILVWFMIIFLVFNAVSNFSVITPRKIIVPLKNIWTLWILRSDQTH